MTTTLIIEEYIASFQRGNDFTPPSVGDFIDGQPDEAGLELLRKELVVANPSVRENIVNLLVDMGRQIDSLTPKGADVIQNQSIIALLAGAGLAKDDLGREAAMEALRKLVTQSDLAQYGDAFTEAIKNKPTEEAFLLVAKTKPPQAKGLVERLGVLPKWKEVDAAKIARAALGDKDIEDEFLNDLEEVTDGKVLAQVLGPLALIGTSRSLKAIAEYLRTPLTIDKPGAYEKSVRLNVLDALLYNFPDQPVLYPNNIAKEEDFTAAENFCIRTLGVTYSTPPPPFMTYRGYPLPMVR